MAGLATLSAQIEALALEVAVLGGRLDAVAARVERLAAAPAVAAVPPAPQRPPRHAHALRLPLLRAALSEPVADGRPTTAGATAPAADPPAASGAPSAGPAAPERPGVHRRVVA